MRSDSDRKFVVTQHVNTEKHKQAAVRKKDKNAKSGVQQLVTNYNSKRVLILTGFE